MALNAKHAPAGKKRNQAPALEAGSYPARLVQVLDMGLQEQRAFEGKAKDPRTDIHTTYELLDEFLVDEDGNEIEDKPRWFSETFPMYSPDSDRAKSTIRYLAIDPEIELGWQWDKLLGQPVMLNLVRKPYGDKRKGPDGELLHRNFIAGSSPMREKDAKKAPDLKNEPRAFSTDEPDLEVFLSLPDWIREKMKEALDFENSALDKALQNISEEDEIAKRREEYKKSREKAEKDGKSKKKKKEAPKEEPETDDGDDW